MQGAVGADRGADGFGRRVGVGGCYVDGGGGERGDGRLADFEQCDVILLPSRLEEDHAQPSASGAAGTAAAVQKDFRVAGRVDLDDQINLGNVQASRRDVGGQKDYRSHRVDEGGKVLLSDLRGMFAV